MKLPKKTFTRTLKNRIEDEIKQQKQTRKQKLSRTLGKTSNLFILFITTGLIALFWQTKVANPLLTLLRPLGKDYFNSLTFARFITTNFPFPPSGWLSFWNGGIPIIGGYPTGFFFLISPLTHFFDVATSLELASLVALLLFLIFSHFLFYEITRNHILSLTFTIILGLTPATYYALVLEGSAINSSTQWFSPLVLFLIVRFLKFQQAPFLLAASIVSGISMFLNPTLGLFSVIIPSLIYLSVSDTGDPQDLEHTRQLQLLKPSFPKSLKTKIRHTLTYALITLSIGSTGFYSLITQTLPSVGLNPCSSPLCWGKYPQDLIWFTPLLVLPIIVFFPSSLISLRFKKVSLLQILAPTSILTILVLYIISAYLHLINPLAGVLLPQRLYWLIGLMTLTLASIAYKFTQKASQKLSLTSSALFIIAFSILIPLYPGSLNYQITNRWQPPQALPIGVEEYIVPKYKIKDISALLPNWLNTDDKNYRIDSIRPDFSIWWNYFSKKPSTRGYSNTPPKEYLNWLYYLQSSTISTSREEVSNPSTYKNQALFLFDHFAIDTLHKSGEIRYDPLLIDDPEIVIRSKTIRDWTYHQLSNQITSPIITPTNAARVLVVSNQKGYETFIRSISLTNLNSKVILPIKGPQSIDDLDQNLLSMTDAIVLYDFKGTRWEKIEKYLDNGGQLFIDLGSTQGRYIPILPESFGIRNLQIFDNQNTWNLSKQDSILLNNIDIEKFSPLIFKDQPWKFIAPQNREDLHNQIFTILSQNNSPILTQQKFGSGKIIHSSINLPYHIINYNNPQEAQLLANILNELIDQPQPVRDFSVNRSVDVYITVSTENTKGIYFKENFHPGWKSTVNGSKTNIYNAGLGFMYIPLLQQNQETNHITIEFRGSLLTWSLPLISILSITTIAIYTLTPKPFNSIKKKVHWHITLPLKSWWKKD